MNLTVRSTRLMANLNHPSSFTCHLVVAIHSIGAAVITGPHVALEARLHREIAPSSCVGVCVRDAAMSAFGVRPSLAVEARLHRGGNMVMGMVVHVVVHG